ASILETEILPARIEGYDPSDLDAVTAAGEVIWVGVEPIGDRDGRIALYLAEHQQRLMPPDAIRLEPDAASGSRTAGRRKARTAAIESQLQLDPRETAILE